MNRILIIALLMVVAGCDVQQPAKVAPVNPAPKEQTITVNKGETAPAAIARVAKTLPADQAEDFTTAAEVLGLHHVMRSTAPNLSTSIKAIDGKTPSQIIAEYNRLDDDVKERLGMEIFSQKLSETLRANKP